MYVHQKKHSHDGCAYSVFIAFCCKIYIMDKKLPVAYSFLYNRKLHFLLYKKPPAGCALRRTMMMSQATAAGARMCQGTFFVLPYSFPATGRSQDKTHPRTGCPGSVLYRLRLTQQLQMTWQSGDQDNC